VRSLYVLGATFVGLSVGALTLGLGTDRAHDHEAGPIPAPLSSPGSAAGWFAAIRPFCNPVEVESRYRWMPPPATDEGIGYSAACFALAGKVDRAREIINTLPPGEQWKGAGIVFNVAHPVADAGDDRSAGPIMEMVVEYWPNHYMALYHAGMSNYALGRPGKATKYLTEFLAQYQYNDGWRTTALQTLERMAAR
jgi:hypothetical protein